MPSALRILHVLVTCPSLTHAPLSKPSEWSPLTHRTLWLHQSLARVSSFPKSLVSLLDHDSLSEVLFSYFPFVENGRLNAYSQHFGIGEGSRSS